MWEFDTGRRQSSLEYIREAVSPTAEAPDVRYIHTSQQIPFSPLGAEHDTRLRLEILKLNMTTRFSEDE